MSFITVLSIKPHLKCLEVILSNNTVFYISKNNYSGKVVQTTKDFIIQHEGIYLGTDVHDVWWAFDTSNRHGGPRLVSGADFCRGRNAVFPDRSCAFKPDEVIKRAIIAFHKNEPYDIWQSNCQHLASYSCEGVKRSRQLENVGKACLAFVGVIAVAKTIDYINKG